MSPDVLELVYDVVAEFGPQRAVPVRTRVMSRAPGLDEAAVDAAIASVGRFEARAFDLAGLVWDDRLTQDAARAQLAREFPMLASRSKRAMGQAMVFVMK